MTTGPWRAHGAAPRTGPNQFVADAYPRYASVSPEALVAPEFQPSYIDTEAPARRDVGSGIVDQKEVQTEKTKSHQ